MPPEDLWEWIRRQPFQPFRLHLTDGTAYEVRHPELIMVGRRSAVIGIAGAQQGPPFYERTATVSLPHIVRLEPMESALSA
jgi:hypothetical protein